MCPKLTLKFSEYLFKKKKKKEKKEKKKYIDIYAAFQ